MAAAEDDLLPIAFPTRGLDVSRGPDHQPAGTTPVGTNVRVCEPSTLRQRGGSRPGTRKYIAGRIPAGDVPFQELNSVVIASADALATGIEDPGTTLVTDPSSDGLIGDWGTGSLGFNDPYTGDPVTGAAENTRNPYDANGRRSQRRDRGSGYQPNKNVVSGAQPASPVAHHCFQGQIVITITKPLPDPFGFTGQTSSFTGVLCAPYVAGNLIYTGPKTAEVTKRATTDSDSTVGTLLLDHIAHWLYNHVGSDSFGVVTSDLIGLPSSGTCSGDPCGGAPPATLPGTAVGAVISASLTP